ncbi:hypothetical protein AAIH32_12065 [Pseudarthrobacter oxydans]|uniref:hypothetical protein n=1 Tax=Pseudarthrobacter oxydans TaxID=1671 RepID=UPI003D2D96F7
MSADMRELSRRRVAEAGSLLQGEHWSGAYYLAGYAVECALKACILSSVRKYHMPEKTAINDSYSHDIEKLARIAGITSALQARQQSDTAFAVNWRLVTEWSEASRYEIKTEIEAREMMTAVTHRVRGVLPWIRKQW